MHGISVSPGIVIAEAFLYKDENLAVPRYSIGESQLSCEVRRYEKAVQAAHEELMDLKQRIEKEHSSDHAQFLDSHILMIRDPVFTEKVFEKMKTELLNAEWVVQTVIQDLVEILNASEDLYLRERSMDINDAARRIINNLMMRKQVSLADLDKDVILVTTDLLPSDTLLMNKKRVKGIVMDGGGPTSHTAILARSFGIPAVLGLHRITREAGNGNLLVIDSLKGRVIVNPDDETLGRYQTIRKEYQKRESSLLNSAGLPSETRDGKTIRLKANMEVCEELEYVRAFKADGVGLFRSEFLIMRPDQAMDEDLQYKVYREVLAGMDNLPVTIRTFDVGGDKLIREIEAHHEKNPLLGWRAIRFCLERVDIFKIQLRALLRASTAGSLRIMFPMISGVGELEKALGILDEVREELRSREIPFKEDVPVGCMIEVPSAALTSDILAKKADFFSIGTNDLIQYSLAADRGNEKIANMYEPFHPGVLRLIKMVVDNAHGEGIPVGMCGEMAGDPVFTAVLLGLGLDELSVSVFGIPKVKRIIRDISMKDAENFTAAVMGMDSAGEIRAYARTWMEEHFEFIPGE